MYGILFNSILSTQTVYVSNWSKCHYMDNEYVKYRNISIYEDNKLIIDTFNNFKYMSTLYNIIELCPEEDNKDMIIVIIFCSVMTIACICGFKCMCKYPNKIGPF